MQNVNPVTMRSGLYLALRYGLGILISLGNMLVLTWWIGPHAYGLFVTVIGISGFLASLVRAGADTYLVRLEPAPDDHAYHVALTLIAINAIILVVLGVTIVPLLALWFGSHEFVVPYVASLTTIPLTGWAGPPTAKLERALDFGKVAGIELGGQVLALVVSIVLAWRHMGVWAPVAGLLAWQLWAVSAALHSAQMTPRFSFDRHSAKAMLSFGFGYTMSLRAWQLRTLVNPLLVGRFAGAESVAYVGLSIRIAEGLGFVRIAAGRLAVAALSRLRHDPGRMRWGLQRALEFQILTLGPLLCVFTLASPLTFTRIIGSRWLPSMSVFPWVAAAVLANSIYNLQASALFVLGEQWTVFRSYLLQVVLLALFTWKLLPKLGIRAYGCADLLACGAYLFLHLRLARHVQISFHRVYRWTLAFMLPIFSALQPYWQIAVLSCVPLCIIAIVEFRQNHTPRSVKLGDGIGTQKELLPVSTGD